MSCIEIHKENVRDLLNEDNECANIMTNSLKFKQTEIEVESFGDVEFLLERARSRRTTGSTAMNNQSSRSHSIYQLKIRAQRVGYP